MKRYKISEFSRLMGVSNDLVKHYQESGILFPEINEENKYRYYTIRHGERIVASRRFRSMGFGLQDTKTLLYEKNTDEVNQMLEKKVEENEQLIKRMQLKNECLQELQQEYKEVVKKAGTFETVESPAFYFIPHVRGNVLIDNAQIVKEVTNWMENIEYAYKAYLTVNSTKEVGNECLIGFLMKKKYFNALGLQNNGYLTLLPAQRQTVFYYRWPYHIQENFQDMCNRVIRLAESQGIVLKPETMIMQHIFDDHVDGIRYVNYIVRSYEA